MAESTKKKKRRKKAPKKRQERRFDAEPMTMNVWFAAGGAIAAAVLGLGVYGQWVRDGVTESGPIEHAQWIVVVGALGLAAVLWFGDKSSHPVRVGDGGIAIERGSELTRLAWCDMESVSIAGGNLVAAGDGMRLTIPVNAQPRAVAWAVQECEERMPEVLEVKRGDTEKLPDPRESDGEVVDVEGVQVAGKECAASGKLISFERDARVCRRCGEVYHQSSVPAECETCGAKLGSRAGAA